MKHKQFIQLFVIFIVTLSMVPQIHAQPQYNKTPRDMEGPFYPTERQSDEDNDLINVQGTSTSASGDVINLKGIVYNENGTPQGNVIIEIWQTDTNGLYKHPADRSKGARDPFFQYWGKAQTDNEGNYSFKTIIPGEYEPRPPHIHFKVWVDGTVVLTSQMYIIKNKKHVPNINEQLKLNIVKNNEQEYSGFFTIVY